MLGLAGMDTVTIYLSNNMELRNRLESWFGPDAKYVHVWEQDGTFFVVVNTSLTMNFVRLWKMGGQMQISVDQRIPLGSFK